MKRALGGSKYWVFVVIAAAVLVVWGTMRTPISSSENVAGRPPWDLVYARLPMSFEANRGQSDPAVQFLSRGHGYSVFLTSAEAVLVLSKRQGREDAAAHAVAGQESKIEDSKPAVLRMRLRGAANTQPQVSG